MIFISICFVDTELHVVICFWHAIGAEQQIPEGKHKREILIYMLWVATVMHLVMRGRAKKVAQFARPAQPDMRVAQIVAEHIESERKYADTKNRWY